MKKFIAGLLLGTVAGSSATYFILRRAFAEKAAEAIESYAKYAEERINSIIGNTDDEDEESEDDEEPEQGKIKDKVADGIKKYQHYAPQLFDEAVKGINMTKNVENEVKENIKEAVNAHTAKALKNPLNVENSLIVETDEDEFLESKNEEYKAYERVTLDFLFPQNELFWGYNTDCQVEAEDHYGEEREDLIGQCWRWATDYTDGETGTGAAYVRNDKLKVFFEIIFHVDIELDATGKYDID